ncbi:MAG: hypothetical protein QNJ36_20325 [Calothrix sp. MO_167.B42]|nr:hypothetical protein [Calothrix sp. MO_167.B42]
MGKVGKNKSKWIQIYSALLACVLLIVVYFIVPSNWELIRGIIVALIAADLLYLLFAIPTETRKVLSQKVDLTKNDIITSTVTSTTENFKQEIDQLREELVKKIEENKKLSNGIPIESLYLLQGLKGKNNREPLFQNFHIDRSGKNVSAVSFLWADTYSHCTINASIQQFLIEGETLYFLQVYFDNKEGSYGCNLSIVPQDALAVDNTSPKRKYLLFDARIPKEASQDKGNLSEVAVAIRVVNGYMQHWEYARSSREYIQLPVSGEVWRTLHIDLEDKDQWALFDSDGNTSFKVCGSEEDPNFDIISFVIFKFGKTNLTPGEPQGGKGIIDIKNIRLSNTTFS